MKVRYRLIEKHYPGEGWETWGVLYENRSGRWADHPVLIISVPDDDRRTGRHLEKRIVELGIRIEDGERLVDETYPTRFRVSPDIYLVEGRTHQEIWQKLWDRIFTVRISQSERAGKPKDARQEYAIAEPHHLIREDKAEDLHPPDRE
jgi:DNA repair photolyase